MYGGKVTANASFEEQTKRRFMRRFLFGKHIDVLGHSSVDGQIARCSNWYLAITPTKQRNSKMANDKAYFTEYMGFIEIGATEAEALMEVATANEVSVGSVFDALVRQGLHNPCGQSKMYCY